MLALLLGFVEEPTLHSIYNISRIYKLLSFLNDPFKLRNVVQYKP
jgi:hypothetical protein